MSRKSFDADEQKRKIMRMYGYSCVACGGMAYDLAHLIAQTKPNIKKHGEQVIHHLLNMVPVCRQSKCNDSQNIGNNPGKVEDLLERIREYDEEVVTW